MKLQAQITDAARNRHVATMAFGSLLLAIGAVSVGWLPPLFNVAVNPILEAMRLSDAGVLLGRISAVVGGAIILHTWLRIGVDVLRQQLTDVKTLWQSLIASILPLVMMPPLFSRDLYSYIAQGRLMDNGINPYTHGVGAMPGWFQLGADPMWAEAPTPYGPICIAFQGFVAHVLPHSPWWSMLVLKFAAIIGLILIGMAVTRLATQHGLSAPAVFWLTALNPLMLFHLVAGGHNDALMIAGMLWAFVFANRNQTLFALLAIVAASGIKPIALLALPFVALALLPRTTTWRAVVGAWLGCAAVVIGALSAIGAALGLGLGWISALSTPGSVRTLLSPSTAVGQIFGFVGNGFNRDITDTAITFSRTTFILIAIVLLALIVLRPDGQSPLRQAGFAFTAVVALSPVMQPWYLLWALPLVVASGLARSWHLRTIVVGTAFFVIYALADMNVVTDSTIDATDFISIIGSGAIVLIVLLASKSERELITGSHYALGLRPRTEDEAALAQSQRMSVSRR